MDSLFITATNTEVGKTYTTLKLIELFSTKGLRVVPFKPIESGFVDEKKSDAFKLLEFAKRFNPLLSELKVSDICPIRLTLPAAPYIAQDDKIELGKIDEAYEKLSKLGDIVLIEGAGGMMTPINIDYYMIDLAKRFSTKILLVCDDRLGCINTALLNISYLESKKIPFIWCINDRDKSFYNISYPYFRDKFSKTLLLSKDLEKIAEFSTKGHSFNNSLSL